MAYSDFTYGEVKRRFGVHFDSRNLFPEVSPVAPSAWLTETLATTASQGFNSEKSRSERLVSPILFELSRRNQHAFSIYSGLNLDVDPAQGLNGECDFLLSFSRIQDFVTAPIFCITEAKKQDIEHGTIQCSAQLIAARRFNELEGNAALPILHGCSTTGVEWRFIRYEQNDLLLDEKRYLISDLPALLGVLQHILDTSRVLAPST